MTPAPDDALEIFLQPGDFHFGTEKTRIRTLLGSCVAVTAWHPRKRIGGMCHYMLPHRPRTAGHAPLDGRYAEEAIQLFIREMIGSRTLPGEYQVKLFGGGRMFGSAKVRTHADISQRNVEYGREVIQRYRMPLAAEDLGGEGHRNVVLDLWSGDVWVRRMALSNAPAK